ncbi:MAG: hypothetical protein KKB59_19665 [Spirochaetes bacterium]|nr:hypothetical protein [Spirochaetota bacterium]
MSYRTKKIYKIGGEWYGPVKVELPTAEDVRLDAIEAAKLEIKKKMEKTGFSKEDLEFVFGK